MGLTDRTPPTEQEVLAYRERFSNWGRWGADDQLGTLNFITPEVRTRAASLVRAGRTVSLAHPLATRPSARNPFPVSHYMRFANGTAWDFLAMNYHGLANTHIDAFCHMGGEEGVLYNGRPASDLRVTGARSNSIDRFRDGIVTRGVLYDIPRLRGVEYVAPGAPVHGWELEECARAEGVTPAPGDAVLVRCGAGAYWAVADDLEPAAGGAMPGPARRPGVHVSALEYLHAQSASMLIWDMLEAADGTPQPGSIHNIGLPYMGLPLLDNAQLDGIAEACAEAGRYEFMVVVAPLIVIGGTGSPVNPIAVL